VARGLIAEERTEMRVSTHAQSRAQSSALATAAVLVVCLGTARAHESPAEAATAHAVSSSKVERAWLPVLPFVHAHSLAVGARTSYPYRVETHCHTRHSVDAKYPSSLTPVELLTLAERLGLNAVVFTDHGSGAAARDALDYSGPVRAFAGREVGGPFGHAVIWNVAADPLEAPSHTTLERRAEFAHTHRGLIALAHPGWHIAGDPEDPLDWFTLDAIRRGGIAGDIDAVELWNGQYFRTLDELLKRWISLLSAHVYVPIVGGSDFHAAEFQRLGHAHNIVFCDEPEIATCLWPALQQGRVVISDGPFALVTVNDALPGEVVKADRKPLRVSLAAASAEGGRLRVYLGAEIVRSFELEPSVSREISITLDPPREDSFIRIDIQRVRTGGIDPPVSLLSNPVLVNAGAEMRAWR
jgi:hypothetical protein